MREGNHNCEGADFNKWLKDRPAVIQEMVKAHPPDLVYTLRTTGHRVTIASYSEDGTVTVDIGYEHNLLVFPRGVFGVNPNDLIVVKDKNYIAGNLLGNEKILSEFSELLDAADNDAKKAILRCVWTIEKIIKEFTDHDIVRTDSGDVSISGDYVKLSLAQETYLLKPQYAMGLAIELMRYAGELEGKEQKRKNTEDQHTLFEM